MSKNIVHIILLFIVSTTFSFLNTQKVFANIEEEEAIQNGLFYQKALSLVSRNQSEIKHISEKIRENFPESDYHYVGIGRSSIAITTFLRLTGSAVHEIPASSIRNLNAYSDEELEQMNYYEKVATHINNFLPSDASKKILFIDFANSGLSTIQLERILIRLQITNQLSFKGAFEFFILSYGLYHSFKLKARLLTRLVNSFYIKRLAPIPGRLGEALLYENFDIFASYSEYDIISNINDSPEPNPLSILLVKAMRSVFSSIIPKASPSLSCKKILNN